MPAPIPSGGGSAPVAAGDITDVGAVGELLVQAATAADGRTAIDAVSTSRIVGGLTLAADRSAADMLSSIGAVPTTRTLGSADLSANLSAAAVRAAIGAAASAPSPALPTTNLVADFDASVLSLGAVSSWASSVGTFTAVQATGAAQPVAEDYACGLFRGVVFDGVDDCLTIAHEAALDWTTLAVYVVCQMHRNAASDASSGDGLVIGRVHAANSGTAPYYRWSIRANNHTTIASYLGSGSSMSGATGDNRHLTAGPHIVHMCTGSAGSYAKIDGIHVASAVGTTSVTYPDARTVSMGAGDYSPRANFWRGAIARVLIYGNTTHTAAQRREVEKYLAATYGIPQMGYTGYG